MKKIFICLFLILATVCVYYQIGEHGTVNADDFYITENPLLNALAAPDSNVDYISTQNLVYVFTNTTAGIWMPLTHMLVGGEHLFFGTDYGLHHLVCLGFHVLNTLLVFLLFHRMTGAVWKSAFVAALFALHPLNAEPVAWLVGIRVVFSAFFGLLMLYSYVVYTRRHTAPRFILTITLFACCLASMPMFPALPFLLLLLDYWPLDRIRLFQNNSSVAGNGPHRHGIGYLLVEKAPYIAMLGIAGAGILSCHGLDIIHRYPLPDRLLNALVAYPRYVLHTFFPHKLAAFYPFPQHFPLWQIIGAALFLAGVTIAALLLARSRPYLIIGWLWFIGMMFPLSGIAQIGTQAMADHYMYLPGIGLFIIITWGACDLAEKLPHKARILGAAAGIVLIVLMGLTLRQAGYWKNSTTLVRRALAVTDGNYEAYNYLGQARATQNDYKTAIDAFAAALSIKPDHFKSNFNMAKALANTGQTRAAIDYYQKALAIYPEHAIAHGHLAGLQADQGDMAAAIRHYREALRIKPGYLTARYNLASLLMRKGHYQEAARQYAILLKARPDSPDLHASMAIALHQSRQPARARRHLNRALSLNPGNEKALWLLEQTTE
ncbi:MAG: tetratricopeptide repeat protein [Thermodesulfobacteriota bacterium]|nr:tetratricopeptide repeat protein [Thermodesulfobacteriota bacterium]